jgi:hypothetical protein
MGFVFLACLLSMLLFALDQTIGMLHTPTNLLPFLFPLKEPRGEEGVSEGRCGRGGRGQREGRGEERKRRKKTKKRGKERGKGSTSPFPSLPLGRRRKREEEK